MLTSRYTMDARNPAARREIAALADLAGAVRLPSGAHQRAAGTGVVTDLLIFRRREPDRAPDDTPWEQVRTAELDGAEVPVNEYFLDNPDMVLGDPARGRRRLQRRRPGRDAGRRHRRRHWSQALGRIASAAASRALTWTPGPAAGTTRRRAAARPPGPRTRTGTCKRRPTGHSPRSPTASVYPFPVPDSQGAELRAAPRAARRGDRAARSRGRLAGRQPRAGTHAARPERPL